MTLIRDNNPQDTGLRPTPRLATMLPNRANPIDLFERIAIAEHYDYERMGLGEVHISLPGRWGGHDLTLRWDASSEHLQIFLVLESRSPNGRTDTICRLMSLLNERLAAGHFDYWERSSSMVYRHNISLCGGAKLGIEQAMDSLATATKAAEYGFPASQYVIWAGETPEKALDRALQDASLTV